MFWSLGIESYAVIRLTQDNSVVVSQEGHLNPSCMRMFCYVMQTLLRDPEQAQRSVRINDRRHLPTLKLDFNLALLRDLSAQAPQGGHNPKKSEFGRVKSVGKALNVYRECMSFLQKIFYSIAFLG